MDDSLRAKAEQLACEIASQARTAEDLNGLMRLMMKSALERILNTEMDVHLGRKVLTTGGDAAGQHCEMTAVVEPSAPAVPPNQGSPNRRNGRSKKTVQGNLDELTLATPRDRDGPFDSQLIGRHQRRVLGFDEKILAL